MSPEFGKRGPWGMVPPGADVQPPGPFDCLEGIVQAMLKINDSPEATRRRLNSGGWVQSERAELLEQIVNSRIHHEMRDSSAVWDQSKYDQRREFSLARRKELAHLDIFVHPEHPGISVEFSRHIGAAVEDIIAAYFNRDFVELARGHFHSDDIKVRFTNPTDKQSSKYVVGWGGRSVSASRVEHGRDGTDLFYEARVADGAFSHYRLSDEHAHPVFAEMRIQTRSM